MLTFLLGQRLANRQAEGRKIGAFEGLPAMGLDGLGSASYGPEAMLTVLAAVGTVGLSVVQPITWVILLLLLLSSPKLQLLLDMVLEAEASMKGNWASEEVPDAVRLGPCELLVPHSTG